MDLLVLNKSLDAFYVLDTYTSLIWTDRYNKYGDFELTLPASSELIDVMQQDYYLYNSRSEHVMIIEQLTIKTDSEEGGTFTVTGRSLESLLDRRIIWGLKSLNDTLQNGIKTLLDECLISPSNTNRKIENFAFEASTDPAITELSISAQYTGDNLYDVISGVCEERGIGFKVTLSEDKKFVFKLYAGVDRSYSQTEVPYVVFSPKFDNLISSNYLESRSSLKNVTLVGGEGEGSARRYTAVGDSVGMNRREMFTDARDISSDTNEGEKLTDEEYISQLRQRGKEDLAENVEVVSFEGEAETTEMFVYGEDFFAGDIVQISNEYGHDTTARVVEVVMSEDESGSSVYPTFSVESTQTLPKGYLRLLSIQSTGTQYFDTDYYPNQDTRVVMDIEPITTSNCPIFGARNASKNSTFTAWVINSTTFRSDYGTEEDDTVTVSSVTSRITIDKDKNGCGFGPSSVSSGTQEFQTNYTLTLFALNDAGTISSSKLSTKLYSCQIYSNDGLVRDFVPVKNELDVVGLYDFVERKFYENKGTGGFLTQS